MAIFPTVGDAMNAALAMQRGMGLLGAVEGIDQVRMLKVGIHAGPCMAVNPSSGWTTLPP